MESSKKAEEMARYDAHDDLLRKRDSDGNISTNTNSSNASSSSTRSLRLARADYYVHEAKGERLRERAECYIFDEDGKRIVGIVRRIKGLRPSQNDYEFIYDRAYRQEDFEVNDVSHSAKCRHQSISIENRGTCCCSPRDEYGNIPLIPFEDQY